MFYENATIGSPHLDWYCNQLIGRGISACISQLDKVSVLPVNMDRVRSIVWYLDHIHTQLTHHEVLLINEHLDKLISVYCNPLALSYVERWYEPVKLGNNLYWEWCALYPIFPQLQEYDAHVYANLKTLERVVNKPLIYISENVPVYVCILLKCCIQHIHPDFVCSVKLSDIVATNTKLYEMWEQNASKYLYELLGTTEVSVLSLSEAIEELHTWNRVEEFFNPEVHTHLYVKIP